MNTIKPGPLSGLKILDFTWVLAGPHTTRTLADMGATVIKTEKFMVGTAERYQALQEEKNGVTQCSYHINENRGKKSLCVNLKNPKGIEIIHDLVRKCDVVIENFKPGVMERLQLDYESMKKIKPDIIYCSISAFGHWGPNSQKPGYDVIAQAASGWVAMTKRMVEAPVAIGDTTAAMHACTAILAALYHRMLTGQGQNIDISLVDCLFTLHETAFPSYWISEAVGKEYVAQPNDQQSNTSSPYGIYNGKNGGIAIALMMEEGWSKLVDLMGPGYEWLKTDPRTCTNPKRCTIGNATVVHKALESWVMSLDSVEEAEKKLDAIGIANCRVKSVKELATTDPHLGAREMRIKQFQPFLGTMTMCGNPMKFSETPAAIRGYAPFLGEHNREILSGVLGYSQEKIEELIRDGGVLYEAPEVANLPEELKKMTNQ